MKQMGRRRAKIDEIKYGKQGRGKKYENSNIEAENER